MGIFDTMKSLMDEQRGRQDSGLVEVVRDRTENFRRRPKGVPAYAGDTPANADPNEERTGLAKWYGDLGREAAYRPGSNPLEGELAELLGWDGEGDMYEFLTSVLARSGRSGSTDFTQGAVDAAAVQWLLRQAGVDPYATGAR